MEQEIVYGMTEKEQGTGETVSQITHKIFLNSCL
jgi:hypothetical protein